MATFLKARNFVAINAVVDNSNLMKDVIIPNGVRHLYDDLSVLKATQSLLVLYLVDTII
jgi:hypothetical protein